MTMWGQLLDRDETSRWHSSHIGLVQTQDALGDSLVSRLREAAKSQEDDRILALWSASLWRRLEAYEKESRPLVKLADTGRVAKILREAMKTSFDLLGTRCPSTMTLWYQELEREREARMDMYKAWSEDDLTLFATELQGEEQQLEVLTLLKHGLEKHGDALTQREIDTISTVFDWIARRYHIVVAEIPEWFTTTSYEWSYASKCGSGEGAEEGCLRQVAVWSKLQHPHVSRFFGAYHIGEPFVVYQASIALLDFKEVGWEHMDSWEIFHGHALGLQYLHDHDIAHRFLEEKMLQFAGVDGVLRGLRLEQINLKRETSVGYPSALNDVLMFGLAIFKIIALARTTGSTAQVQDISASELLPVNKPDFVSDNEWELLRGMCTVRPAERMSTIQVVHAMADLASEEMHKGQATQETSTPHVEIAAYVFPLADQNIPELLQQVQEWCAQESEFTDVNLPVYERLNSIFEQLNAIEGPLSTDILDDFCSVLWRFLLRLERQSSGGYSQTASMCASRTIANRNYGLLHEIDRLILHHQELSVMASAPHWQQLWQRIQEQNRASLEICAESPSKFLNELGSDKERSEAATLVQYETGGSITGTRTLPRWFIPPYEVQLKEHIADGSFGSVYHGCWLGTDVVIKQVLTDQSDPENQEQFLHELELWFSLSDLNLVKLYGACHEGHPFFVCERANNGTLGSYLKGKDRHRAWTCLWDAASGLAHLHEHKIVHGDLKGNNVLVSNDSAKLADFGLSFSSTFRHDSQQVATGGVRWKAPECLLGACPTFASDVYSFGMCIIEALTGEYPWGKSISDMAVKHKVSVKKQIPRRPPCFQDDEWELVERMCCFEPEERINAHAVMYQLQSWV